MEVGGVVVVSEVVGPGSDSTNVQAEIFLVGSRADGEGVELARVQGSTGNLHPLSSLVVKSDWPLEVDSHHQRRQDFGPNDSHFSLSTTNTDEQIDSVDDSRSQKEVSKERVLH